MKLAEQNLAVEKSGNFPGRAFTIQASRHSFRILSSALYSNKIKAIIRELSTNALDSHVAAGCPEKPFYIHLPNRMTPTFTIRDYGTGLSDDDIFGIYTTYFASNKSHSNDYVGCLGLGSKTPFSYTDSFTVSSYFNGTKCIYTAFISEDGVPDIAKMAEVATDEENGLEISFSVQSNDCYEFASEATNVLRYFDVKPTIGGQHVEISDIQYAREMWFGDVRVVHEVNGQSQLVMGNIPYPVDEIQCKRFSSALYDCGAHFYLPIGSVEIQPSREGLSYTKDTIAYLDDLFLKYITHVTTDLRIDIQNQPSYWDAACRLRELKHHSFFREIADGLQWQNKDLNTSIEINLPINIRKIRMFFGKPENREFMKGDSCVFFPEKDRIFVLDDNPSARIGRCKQYSQNNNAAIVYLLSNDKDIDAFKQQLGLLNSHIALASSLPYDKSARSVCGNSFRSLTKIRQFDESACGLANNAYWNDTELDLDAESGQFVYIHHNQLIGYRHVNDGSSRNLKDFIRRLKVLDSRNFNVIGIKKSRIKSFEHSNWPSMWDVADEIIDNARQNDQLALELCQYRAYKKIRRSRWDDNSLNFDFGIDLLPHIAKITSAGAKAALEIIVDWKAAYDKLYQSYLDIVELLQEVDFSRFEINVDAIKALRENFYRQYPLTEYVELNDDSVNHVVDYINSR